MLEAPLIVGVIFLSLVAIVKIISETLTRRRLIEKGMVDDKVRQLLIGQTELGTLNNLKWGMVLVGIGVAALLAHWWPYYWSEEGAIGLIFVFAGLGFLIYYPIAKSRLKKIERENRQSSPPSQ